MKWNCLNCEWTHMSDAPFIFQSLIPFRSSHLLTQYFVHMWVNYAYGLFEAWLEVCYRHLYCKLHVILCAQRMSFVSFVCVCSCHIPDFDLAWELWVLLPRGVVLWNRAVHATITPCYEWGGQVDAPPNGTNNGAMCGIDRWHVPPFTDMFASMVLQHIEYTHSTHSISTTHSRSSTDNTLNKLYIQTQHTVSIHTQRN